jgi:phosphatidylserine/phosphatidylglycerophosphate/cardiolipin synthase-like enzyme
MKRQPYTPGQNWIVVSPANARQALAAFIEGAQKDLHIYDPSISDPAMTKLLEQRAKSGVAVKVLGRMTRHSPKVEVAKLHPMRLHTRMILRDGKQAFLGSQSLRAVELDRRREVGMIFEDDAITASMMKTFLADWDATMQAKQDKSEPTPVGKVAKKVAKAMLKGLPPVAPMVEAAIEEVGSNVTVALDAQELEESVKDAVKHAIKSAVKEAMEAPSN